MRFLQIPTHLEVRSPDTRTILAELNEDVIRRMRNWMWWRAGYHLATSSTWGLILNYGTAFHRNREMRVPVLVIEAEQTLAALRSIEQRYASAVSLFWERGEEASFREMGIVLACHHETCRARILYGHRLLTAEFYRRQAAAATHLCANA
jgi:hypothetical protein